MRETKERMIFSRYKPKKNEVMQRLIILLTLICMVLDSHAIPILENSPRIKYKDGPAFIYRVYLTDKDKTPYTLERPHRFLSHRSIERRKRQGLPLDSTDLPVHPGYIRQFRNRNMDVIGKSRWHNTLLIRLKDSTAVHQLDQMACVKDYKLVWLSPDSTAPNPTRSRYHDSFEEHDRVEHQVYGKAFEQIKSLQGDQLHQHNLRGEGMMIAILDGGFKNADRIPAFQHIDICGWHDFITPSEPALFSETDHGTKVLSAIALNIPHFYIGTAPKSSFWLLRSEDQQTEQEVEEDYWTMAAEFADSAGCDLINSSLGYTEYDYKSMSHPLWQLDGHTTFISQSASMLAAKGIILVNSAGNSGMGSWKKIGVPADADDILTVGAVSNTSPHHIAPFSSIGPTQDGRIKPDVVAFGASAFLVNGRGDIMEDMGTSFSSPIICGLAACLWQAYPHKTASEIIQYIRQSGNNYEHPDNIYGYGLPDFWKAHQLLGAH